LDDQNLFILIIYSYLRDFTKLNYSISS